MNPRGVEIYPIDKGFTNSYIIHSERTIMVDIPEKCVCGFENLKLFGNRLNGRIRVDVRCMRCGKILWEK